MLDDELMVLIAAHPDLPTPMDTARLQSYMKPLGIGGGILANFGKRELTMQAVLAN